jgi:hypothetical protein
MKAQYKVDNKVFDRLADARKHRKQLKASLPISAVVTIYKSEQLAASHEVMWVPYE